LVLRDTTERVEGLQAGTARLIGTKASHIIDSCKELLKKPDVVKTMSKKHYPYGDGYAAKRIVDILATKLK
jgi:UDP-N-acetylglucosamine 2-epimerase (non-hydrolysing)